MSKAIRLSGLCISLVIALTGCVTASGGKEFDRTVVQTFHEGQTTQADVVAKLGQPQIKTSGEDGPAQATPRTSSRWSVAIWAAKPMLLSSP